MAQGDAVTMVQSTAGGATMSYQPASGEHVLITEYGSTQWTGGAAPDGYPNLQVSLGSGNIVPSGATLLQWERTLRVFVDNSAILYVKNLSSINAQVAISGVQIK
jgi:hypothetical protein